MSRKTAEIRRLNDCFRKNPALLGRVMLTSNVNARGVPFVQKCLDSVKVYDAFTDDKTTIRITSTTWRF